ncbi:MAG: ferredoxin family protein [Succinivibrionaceae bacterium]
MSIIIDESKCIGCGRCVEQCPGNLLKLKGERLKCKVLMKHPRDCWGCTSCVKSCPNQAIKFYLGADIGGTGSTLSVTRKNFISFWKITDINGDTQCIEVNAKNANKY